MVFPVVMYGCECWTIKKAECQHYSCPKPYLWRRKWHPTPVLLPGKSHGRRSLVGCSPWGREESDMTERLHFHFSLSCIGEGNGNPLQCSCLENSRDRGARWASVSGVAQSWTRLKWLSSSSSSSVYMSIPVYPFPLPLTSSKFVFYICGSISVLWIDSFVLFFFLDSTCKQSFSICLFLSNLFHLTYSL